MRALIVWAALAVSTAPALAAQVVRGRVLGPDSVHGVPGAIVLLLDSAGRQAARTLADPDGAFALRAPSAGSYHIQTLRIGFRPFVGPTFSLAKDSVANVSLVVSTLPVALEAIKVTGKDQCRTRPAEGSAALELWTEARKALLASVLSRESRSLNVEVAVFQRDLDTAGDRVTFQHVSVERGASKRPFYTLSASDFDRHGYAEVDAGGTTFRAPDADVLLDDVFGAGHCLHVAASRDTSLVGLAFAPARDRDGIVDVAGTLWLDRHTADLRSLEFRYTNVPRLFSDARGGGLLQFTKLPGGAWIISGWNLRLPVIVATNEVGGRLMSGSLGAMRVQTGARQSARVDHVQISGGAVLDAKEPGGAEWTAPLPAVEGSVIEWGTGRPIAGARVTLTATEYRTETDSRGAFRFSGVLPGRYGIVVHDPGLDSMGYKPGDNAEVVVPDSGSVRVQLKVPWRAQAVAEVCHFGDRERFANLALLYGVAKRADGAPVGEGHEVTASWVISIKDRKDSGEPVSGVVIGLDSRQATTDASGQFRVCGVPVGKRLYIDVAYTPGSSARMRLDSLIIPLESPSAYRAVHFPAAQTPSSLAAVLSTIAGIVRDSAGRPLAGVGVHLAETGLSTVTDSTGVFRLSRVPPGKQVLEFRRIGLMPIQGSVEVGPGETVHATYEWNPKAVKLAPVVVTARERQIDIRMSDFEQRRALGRGQFVSREEFEKYAPLNVSDVLRRMHSLHVADSAGAMVAVSTRGPKLTPGGLPVPCVMRVALDGAILSDNSTSLNEISISDVAGIEVYAGSATIPPQFNTYRTDIACGLVMIWTRGK